MRVSREEGDNFVSLFRALARKFRESCTKFPHPQRSHTRTWPAAPLRDYHIASYPKSVPCAPIQRLRYASALSLAAPLAGVAIRKPGFTVVGAEVRLPLRFRGCVLVRGDRFPKFVLATRLK